MKIAIIGCGNMGLVYAKSFIQYGLCQPDELVLIDKNQSKRELLEKEKLGKVTDRVEGNLNDSEIIVIAVKPQDFHELSFILKASLNENHVILSIMAGITIAKMEAALDHSHIVRAMPNLPAQIGMGMTGFTAHPNLSMHDLHTAETLLNTTGRAIYLEKEGLLDAVTALSGTGPAYFFFFVQQMIQAGKKMGLEESTARVMANQTMLGSYHLINNANRSLEDLISSVKSRGGTTEAAFEILQKKVVGEGFIEAILRAEERSRELSGE